MTTFTSVHMHLSKNQGLQDAKGTFQAFDVTIPPAAVAGDEIVLTNMSDEMEYSQLTAVCNDVAMAGLTVDIGVRERFAREGQEAYEDLTFFAADLSLAAVAAQQDMVVPATPVNDVDRTFEHDIIITLKGTVATHRGKIFWFVPQFRNNANPATT